MISVVNFFFLLSKTQNYLFLLQCYQQKTTKKYRNFLAKDMKDQFNGINIKQKVRRKIRQMNKDIFSNQIFLESIDYYFWFIQTKMQTLKDSKILFTKKYKKL